MDCSDLGRAVFYSGSFQMIRNGTGLLHKISDCNFQKSYTFGLFLTAILVFLPRFLNDLSLSVEYRELDSGI